jgi:hypothetical protein
MAQQKEVVMAKKKVSDEKVIALLHPGTVTRGGHRYSAADLRVLAESSPDYFYNEVESMLYYRVPSNDGMWPGTEKLKTACKPVHPDELTQKEAKHVDNLLDELANETNLRFRRAKLSYTKVWVLLQKLLQDQALRANTLVCALDLAGSANETDLVRCYGPEAAAAHTLIETYLSHP